MKRKMLCAAASLILLTACGKQTEPVQNTADITAGTTAADTAVSTAVTDLPETDAPETETAAARPILHAHVVASEPPLKSAEGDEQRLYIGDELSVSDFTSDKPASENKMTFLFGDTEYSGNLCEFVMVPTEECVKAMTDDELFKLAAALDFQYNAIFMDFMDGVSYLGMTGTEESYTDAAGKTWMQMTPAYTMDNYLAEFNKYFTSDFILTNPDGSEETINDYIMEKDGSLWTSAAGYGNMAYPTTLTVESLSSRSDTEMTFEIKVTQDAPQEETESLVKTEQLTIGLENGVWKCRHLTLKWNVA